MEIAARARLTICKNRIEKKEVELPSDKTLAEFAEYLCNKQKNLLEQIAARVDMRMQESDPAPKNAMEGDKNKHPKLCQLYNQEKQMRCDDWRNLLELTGLIFLQTNWKRPVDAHYKTIEHFQNRKKINENCETFRELDPQQQEMLRQVEEVHLLGKQENPTKILLVPHIRESIEKILQWRSKFGVVETDPYIFNIFFAQTPGEKRRLILLKQCENTEGLRNLCKSRL